MKLGPIQAIAALSGAHLLAACQGDPGVAPPPPGATMTPAPVYAPTYPATVGYPAPVSAGTTRTTTSTWSSPDGSQSVSRSRSTSASVSVDPSIVVATMMPQTYGAPVNYGLPAPAGPGMMMGTWQLTDGAGGRSCSIDLKQDQSFGMYAAWTRMCNTSDLFQVNRWQMRGNEIVLLDLSGNAKASLMPTGPDRFDGFIAGTGQPLAMWR